MVDDLTAVLAIGAMAGVTYLTRAGGILLMGFVTLTPRVEAFLRSLSSSVLVALVVPAAVNGGGVATVALVVTVAVMLATRSALGAMLAGVAVAAAGRNLAGLA